MGFDTHKYIKALMNHGMKEPQAESIVQIVTDSRELDLSKLATKDQLENVKLKVEHVQEALGSLEERVTKLEDKVDARFIALEEKIDARFIALDEKIDAQSIRLERKIESMGLNNRWVIGMAIAVIGLLVTVVLRGH